MSNTTSLKVSDIIKHAFFNVIITTVVSLFAATLFRYIAMESVVINISPSSHADEKYITIISVQNLKKQTLSDLSLYFDKNCNILEIKSDDAFKKQQQYIKVESISPQAQYCVMVYTEQPISEGQIITESTYKTRIDYSNDDSPFIFQMLQFIIPVAFIIFMGSGIQIWIDRKERIKISQELQAKQDSIKEKLKDTIAKNEALKKELSQLSESVDNEQIQLDLTKKNIQNVRFYYRIKISDLRKELSFWRDTVRKLLYNSENEFQTADKVIETVTSTLKTYTTRERSDENLGELLYLAQLMVDSRELHNKHNSSEQNNNA